MRNALLGGLVLALVTRASPVDAQDGRTYPQQPTRAARLGTPTALPAPRPTDPVVTPAGLLTTGQSSIPTTGQYSIPSPLPVSGMPPVSGGSVFPTPRPLPGTPSVTESRNLDDSGMPIPTPPYGVSPTVVPSVVPGSEFPSLPGLEDPQSPGCPTGQPAVNRLQSCNRWYASAEYLMWWTRTQQVPPLLTTGSPAFNGILGQGDTKVLYGGNVGNTFHDGGRFTLGRWFGDSCWGVEGRFFFLGEDPSTFAANSTQYPVLARPFSNANTPVGPFSELIAFPGLSTGGALIRTDTSLWGFEANLRRVLYRTDSFQLDALVGYRFMELQERLSIEEGFLRTPGSTMVGTPAVAGHVGDVFKTMNQFNGGQIGMGSSYQRGRWFVNGRATVAFGELEQMATIAGGQTLVFANGATGQFPGGLLVLPGANIGTYHNHQFAVLPEANLNLGYQITSRMRVYVGYNFLYLGNALRPGGTVPTTIDAARIPNFPLAGNPAPLPGVPLPSPTFHTNPFFAQGINFGLMGRW